MRKTFIICDRCKRNFNDVDSPDLKGRGSLKFKFEVGAAGGGYRDTIEFEDLCIECVNKIRSSLDHLEEEL